MKNKYFNLNSINRFVVLLFVMVSIGFTQKANAQVDTVKMQLSSVSGSPGDTVCVGVSFKNFNKIISAQWLLSYDAAKLGFVSIKQGSLPNLDIANSFNTNTNGQIRFIYFDTNSGVTLVDDATAFSICFVIKGAINDTDCLKFGSNSFQTEYINSDNKDVPFKYDACAGKVTITPPTLKPLKLSVDKGKVKKDESICTAVRVYDFKKITQAEFELTWDPTVLNFQSIQNVDTRFGAQGTSTNFYVVNTGLGSAQIKWNAAMANTTNVTLPDSTPIFLLCFKAIGAEGSLECIKSNTVSAKIITSNSNNQNVGMNYTQGCIAIPAKIEPIKLWLCDESQVRKVTTGEEFCVDVKVANFTKIGALKGTFAWDVESFEYVGYQNLNPPNDPNKNVTWTFNPDITNGFLAFILEAVDYSTLSDSAVLMRLCFKARGVTGNNLGITLSNIPVAPEAWNETSQGDNIGVELAVSDCPIIVESAIKVTPSITQPNCKNPLGGKIIQSVTGGTPPYKYQWSPNAYNSITRDVSDLPTGRFFCTITDSKLPTNNIIIVPYDLAGDLTKPVAKATIKGQLECKAGSFVVLDGAGSSVGSDYTYQWISTNGVILGTSNQLQANAQSATTYSIQVKDQRNGCVDTAKVVVAPVPNAPIADAGTPVQIPCNYVLPINLNGCKSTTNGTTFLWSASNGGKVVGRFSQCDPQVVGQGTYTVTVTDTSTGCSAVSKTEVSSDANSPTAIAAVNDSLNCLNNTITLDGSKSSFGAGTNYFWTSLDGYTVDNPTNAKATARFAGKYALKVTNALGCVAQDTVQVYDFSKDTVSAKTIDRVNLSCNGTPIQLNGTGSSVGAGVIYAWTISAGFSGNIVSGANTLTPTVDKSGTYLLTVKNRYSHCEAQAIVTVFQATVPQGVYAGNDSLINCINTELTPNASAPAGNYTIKWTTTNGNIKSGASTIQPILNKAGKYFLIVTENGTGCISKDSLVITEDLEKPKGKVIGEKELTCGKDSIFLTASGSVGADLFEWFSFDGNFTSSPTLPSVSVNKAGTYILLATKVSNGCVDSVIHKITFKYPEKGTIANDTLLCDQAPFTLNASILGNVSGVWSSLDGALIQNPSANITTIDTLNAGENRFVWTVSAPGCPDFAKDTLSVFLETTPILKNDIIVQPNGGEFFNLPVTVNDNLKGTKTWSIDIVSLPTKGTLETSGQKTLRYKPINCFTGEQNFSYQICSKSCPNKCDTAAVKLTLKEGSSSCKDVLIPNTITPNGDGKNDVFRIDAIDYQPEQFKDAELVIFNRWGDVVYKSGKPYANNWSGTNQNGSDLPEGTYYYLIDLNLPSGISYRGDITILR